MPVALSSALLRSAHFSFWQSVHPYQYWDPKYPLIHLCRSTCLPRNHDQPIWRGSSSSKFNIIGMSANSQRSFRDFKIFGNHILILDPEKMTKEHDEDHQGHQYQTKRESDIREPLLSTWLQTSSDAIRARSITKFKINICRQYKDIRAI